MKTYAIVIDGVFTEVVSAEAVPENGHEVHPFDKMRFAAWQRAGRGVVWQNNHIALAPLTPIELGRTHVAEAGFDADKKVILLNKLLSVKEADALAAHPKLVALYTWFETVQGMAIAGQTMFPRAPHTFEEVIAE
jgi:hypothetical protein